MDGRQQRGGRGGASGFRPNNPAANAGAKQLVDLGKYLHKDIQVKFAGGKEVMGKLKGFDTLLNLVLDQAEQIFEEEGKPNRYLGLVVSRGTTVILISPLDGSEEIANPFLPAQ